MIELIGLQKYYNKGKQNEIHVINDVSLNVPESGMCAIFGPSGCGKTTLLNVIGGLDDYETGIITIDGLSMEKQTDLLRNKYIGFIFQNYNLNNEETVFENVSDSLLLCGMRDEAEIERRVMAALANVGMDKFSKRLPDTLSGGQQQRVAIARAIVKNPRIILADEPTGNLDEANTILVMDILKEMSKDRLVLLVTHEENLVDYYCDNVIELSDGKIVGTKVNESANGYAVRDKNDIFLGEYEKESIGNEEIDVSYYGEKPQEPLKLTVINHNGRLLLRIDTPKVAVIDEFSELKIHDGVYQVEEQQKRQQQGFDMSELPPFEGKEYGKLFDFKTSVKRGYNINFKSLMKKKGKRRLRTTLALFAIVFVFMSAIFGTGIRQLLKIGTMYDHNTFYVYAANDGVADRIAKALEDPDSGIDYATVRRLPVFTSPEEEEIVFLPSGFESYGYYESGVFNDNEQHVSTGAMVLPISATGGAKALVGSVDCIKDGRVVITKALADKLLEEMPFDYIETYEDLMGIACYATKANIYDSLSTTSYEARVGCVLDSDANAVYVDTLVHAFHSMNHNGIGRVVCAGDDHYGLGRGEIVFVKSYIEGRSDYQEQTDSIKVGDTFTVHGMNFKVKEIIDATKPADTHGYEDYKYKVEKGYEIDITDEDLEYFLEYEQRMAEVTKVRDEIVSHCANARAGQAFYGDSFIILGQEDYIACANRAGSTTAAFVNMDDGRAYLRYTDPYAPLDLTGQQDIDYREYYALHAVDADAAEKYIRANFGDLQGPPKSLRYIDDGDDGYVPSATYSPNEIRSLYIQEFRREIVPFSITLLVIVGFMSLCMYFIMKSMIMNRTKEIGIYRAIGVTKKNVMFRFAVEAGVVVTFSLIIGYILGSAVSFFVQANTTLFYYPVWYALIILVFLYALGIFCGVIPVLLILRKTPSAILAKYDI
ncbi:MAG: ABC transporter ATP-binding protein/permease [Lachnospiraceae bacterium]|nr:ABC transporter ATP-binding protein/permease [Lachnospiraceae bacterium]